MASERQRSLSFSTAPNDDACTPAATAPPPPPPLAPPPLAPPPPASPGRPTPARTACRSSLDRSSDEDEEEDEREMQRRRRGLAAKAAAKGGKAGGKEAADSSADLAELDSLAERAEGDGDDAPAPPFYRRTSFWWVVVPLLASCAFAAAGSVLVVAFEQGNGSAKSRRQWSWRLMFFLASLPWVWWAGSAVSKGLVWGVERAMFGVRNALYFAYAVRRPLAAVVRAAGALGLWAIIMQIDDSGAPGAYRDAVDFVTKLWGCVTLAMTANLLKVLLAKLLASKLNRERQWARMNEALRRERWLRELLKPRVSFAAEAAEPDAGKGGLDAGGGSAPAPGRRARLLAALGRSDGSGAGMRRSTSEALPRRSTSALARTFRRGSEPLPPLVEVPEASPALKSPPGSPASPPPVRIDMEAARGNGAAAPLPPAAVPVPPGLPPVATGRSPERSPRAGGAARSPAGGPSPLRRDASTASTAAAAASGERALRRSTPADRRHVAMRMAQLERHLRKHAQLTFRAELSRAAPPSSVEEEARRTGHFIYWNARAAPGSPAHLDRPYLVAADLEPLLCADADAAFAMLDGDGDGAATLEECVDAVAGILRERRNLAAALADARSIVNILEAIIGVLLHSLFFFFYLAIFDANVGQIWISVSGLLVAFSFAFGSSARATFENVVFLFVVHPYDVGDTLLLDGDNHLVDEIHLNFSACVNSSGQRVWVPTQRLATSTFVNLTASGNKWETLRLFVDLDTPMAAVEAAQAAARGVVAAMPADLASAAASLRPPSPGPESTLPLKVCLTVSLEHAHPGVDLARCHRARTAVYVAVAQALVAAGVKFTAEFRDGLGAPSAAAPAGA